MHSAGHRVYDIAYDGLRHHYSEKCCYEYTDCYDRADNRRIRARGRPHYLYYLGSLLGVAVNRAKLSFPVGKVDMKTLYPMDMEEFMKA